MKFRYANAWIETAVILFNIALDEENSLRREILLRRAISTLYYGTFWEVRSFLELKGTKIKPFKAHQTLRKSLEAKGYKEVAEKLGYLHKIRKNADYDVKPSEKLGYLDWEGAFEKAFHLTIFILREVKRNG